MARAPGTRHGSGPGAIVTLALVAIALGVVAAVPLWGPGMVNTRGGGDSPFLLQRTMALAENLSYGTFPPRWMSHAAYDLGYPFFSYYAALPYYLAGGLTALGLNVLSSIQATQTLGFILAALAMALWSRRIYHRVAAQVLAVIAYTFAPFHLVNVYVRGDSLSEFYAFIWFPLILWALDRVAEKPAPPRILLAAATYAGLILTHNVSALIFSPFALLWGLVASHERRRSYFVATSDSDRRNAVFKSRAAEAGSHGLRRSLGSLILTFVLGFLLTAWFWLPAIAETHYGQMGEAFTAGYFNYSNHFRGANLVQPTPAFSYRVAADLTSVSPFSMGLAQTVFAAIGWVLLIVSGVRASNPADGTPGPAVRMTLSASLVLASLMITPISKLLWDTLPLLEITQFPWRFLSVQALFAAAVTGAIGDLRLTPRDDETADGPRTHQLLRWIRIGLAIGAAVVLPVAALANLRPERLRITPQDVTRENLLLYETFTGNIGTTIRYEYLPEDVVPRLYISEAVIDGVGAAIADGGLPLEAELISRQPNQQVWRVSLPAGDDYRRTGGVYRHGPATVAFPLNWWPDWRATVDGTPVPCRPMPGSGRAAVDLTTGEHIVRLKLYPTNLRRAASGLSLLALIGCLGVAVRHVAIAGSRPRLGSGAQGTMAARERKPVTIPRLRRTVGPIALVLLVATASLMGPLLGQRSAGLAGDGRRATFFDFEVMPYPHAGPIDFGAAELASVELGATASTILDAGPGERLDVTLSWPRLPATPLTATLALVSPAEPRHGVDYTLFQRSIPVQSTTHVLLDLPQDLARGLYLVHLRVEGPTGPLEALTPEGRTMGDLYIGAVRISEGPDLPPDTGTVAEYQDLTLHHVEVRQQSSTDLAIRMGWSTVGTPRNWRLSLRLLDAEGRLVAQQDHQPGYGYLPTTLWRPHELIVDQAQLSIPEGQAPGSYTLRIITYLQATGSGGGEADIPIELTQPTVYDLRDACCEQTRMGATILCQTGEVALLTLSGPDGISEGDDLTLQAEWNALLAPTQDLDAHWRITGPGGGIIAEVEQPLAAGSKTSAWPRFTWVLSPVAFDLPSQVDAGTYRVELTLQADEGESTACGAVGGLTIAPRPRVFDPPEPPTPELATFGEAIRLLGYDTATGEGGQTLSLTLWWQAVTAPTEDLKRFVHLYDPVTESIVTQDDAMPRDWTYPTSWWASGEVVSETIRLDINNVANGSYRLGIGWYDPATSTRLPATLDDGGPAPADRVTLQERVTLTSLYRRWPWLSP